MLRSGLALITMVIATAIMSLTLVGCKPPPGTTTAGKEAAERAARKAAETFADDVNKQAGKPIVTGDDKEVVEDEGMKLLEEAAKKVAEEKAPDIWNELQAQDREEALQPVQEAAQEEHTLRILEYLEEAQREAALEQAFATLEQETASNAGTASPTTISTQASYGTRPVGGTIYTAWGTVPTESVAVSLKWNDPDDGSVNESSPTSLDTSAKYYWSDVTTGYTYTVCAQSNEAEPGHYWYGCGLSFYLSPLVPSQVNADVIMTLRTL